MFNFFSRNKRGTPNALEFIGYDMHNHILPGLDDGSPDIKTSKILLDGLSELGYRGFVFTPHIIPDLYPNNPHSIQAAFNLLLSELPEFRGLPSTIAAEYLVDFQFEKIIKEKAQLSFGKDGFVLIEMSYLVESPNIKEAVFELLTNGFQPILAHPERYSFYHHRFDEYEAFVDAGCLLQLNILSLTGHYGAAVRDVAERLIKKDYYSFIGTDIHHVRHLQMMQQLSSDKSILRKLEKIKNLKNPELGTALLTH